MVYDVAFDLMELKIQRIKNGMSQRDMAIKLGIAPSTYSKKEMGSIKISIDEFIRINDILKIDDQSIFFKKTVDKKQQ